VTVSLHAGPEQAPPQASSADPGLATASSVTFVPFVIETEHFVPQSMPAPPTKPLPVPAFLTVTVNLCGAGGGTPKPAVIDFEPFEPWPVKVIVHVDADPADAQSPPQPENVAPLAGVAVKTTVVFCFISAEHVVGQSIDPLVGSGDGAVT
jgi:hypothetical protein